MRRKRTGKARGKSFTSDMPNVEKEDSVQSFTSDMPIVEEEDRVQSFTDR